MGRQATRPPGAETRRGGRRRKPINADEAVTLLLSGAVNRCPRVKAQAPRRDGSIPRVAGGAREGDCVAHVGEAGDVGEGALEAEAEAGVGDRAVAAQVAVPGVVLAVDAALGHAAVQYFEPLLALAAADDFADPRRQYVHSRDRPAVVVHTHVERFDGLWVFHH